MCKVKALNEIPYGHLKTEENYIRVKTWIPVYKYKYVVLLFVVS